MQSKTGPILSRHALTNLWQFNIFIQKPFDVGYSFLVLFKLCFMIELFLTAYRPVHKYTEDKRSLKKMKKGIFRLPLPSAYKFINARMLKTKKALDLFCNYNDRTKTYPAMSKTFRYKVLYAKVLRKIKTYRHTFNLVENRIFSIATFLAIAKKNFFFLPRFGAFAKMLNLKKFYLANKIWHSREALGGKASPEGVFVQIPLHLEQKREQELFR